MVICFFGAARLFRGGLLDGILVFTGLIAPRTHSQAYRLESFRSRRLLLFSLIGRVFILQFHGLSAADQLAVTGVQHPDDIPADFAFVDLIDLCHIHFSILFYVCT